MVNLKKSEASVLNVFRKYPNSHFNRKEIRKYVNLGIGTISNAFSNLHKLSLIKSSGIQGSYILNQFNPNNLHIFNDQTEIDPEIKAYIQSIILQNKLPKIHALVLMDRNFKGLDYDKIPISPKGNNNSKTIEFTNELGRSSIQIFKNSSTTNIPSIRINFSQENNIDFKKAINGWELSLWMNSIKGVLETLKIFNNENEKSINLGEFSVIQIGIGHDTERKEPTKVIIHTKFKTLTDTIAELYDFSVMVEDEDGEKVKKDMTRFSFHINGEPIKKDSLADVFDLLRGMTNVQSILEEQDTIKSTMNTISRTKTFESEQFDKIKEINRSILNTIHPINESNLQIKKEIETLKNDLPKIHNKLNLMNDEINTFENSYTSYFNEKIEVFNGETTLFMEDLSDKFSNIIGKIDNKLENQDDQIKDILKTFIEANVMQNNNFEKYIELKDNELNQFIEQSDNAKQMNYDLMQNIVNNNKLIIGKINSISQNNDLLIKILQKTNERIDFIEMKNKRKEWWKIWKH